MEENKIGIIAPRKEAMKVICTSAILGKTVDVYGSVIEPFFLAKDIAAWIELKNPSDVVKRVEEDERSKFNLGRQGDAWFLTENGLYEVLMQSRKPLSKKFKSGIKKLLREVRLKGGYIAEKEDETPSELMARALDVAHDTLKRREERLRQLEEDNSQKQETIKLQTEEIKKSAPKVDYYDRVLQSNNNDITITEIAKCIGMEGRSLNKKLQELKIQHKLSSVWVLNQPYDGWNLGQYRTHTYVSSTGMASKRYFCFNERGKRFIIALFNNNWNITSAVNEMQGKKEAVQ